MYFTVEIRCFWLQYPVSVYLSFILFKHTVCPGSVPFLTQKTIGLGVLSSDKPKLLLSKKSMYILHWFCCLRPRTQLLKSSPLYLKVNLKSIIPLVWRQKYTRYFQLALVFPHTTIIKCNITTSCMLLTQLKI